MYLFDAGPIVNLIRRGLARLEASMTITVLPHGAGRAPLRECGVAL